MSSLGVDQQSLASARAKKIPPMSRRQLGATFAFAQGGDLLFEFRQKNFAEHPTCEQVLRAFGIDPSLLNVSSSDMIASVSVLSHSSPELPLFANRA